MVPGEPGDLDKNRKREGILSAGRLFHRPALNIPTLQATPDYAGIRKSLREKGRVVVCVVLTDTPQTDSRLSVAPLEQRMRRYRASQQRFLTALGEKGYSLRYRFRYSPVLALELEDEALLAPVSYTHLTLPTICSV